MNKEEKESFCTYVNEKRQEKKLKMEQLCEGLCDYRLISFWKNGDRMIDSAVQEVILERLGVGAENQEIYLHYPEYERWEARQGILCNIIYEDFEKAANLLELYRKNHNMSNHLEKQFYLSMLAQIRCCQGASKEEQLKLFQEALILTVPQFDKKPLHELVLSIKELNLLLEVERCQNTKRGEERYLEIIEYIEAKDFDKVGMAKIYPKAAYYLYQDAFSDCGFATSVLSVKKMLKYCNQALEYLREASRMYFLWEILNMRQTLMNRRKKKFISQKKFEKVEELVQKCQQNANWINTFEKVYEEFHVPKEMFEYCYLYVMRGVSCISDVIRVRRNMLGLSARELCEGFCDVRTVKRLEKRETCPQRAIVRELFVRLGLSKEYVKTKLVTEKHEAKRLMEVLNNDINNLRWEKVEGQVAEIRKLVSLEERVNRQALMKYELNALREQEKISKEEYYQQMKNALELTVPFIRFLQPGEKYLTHMELLCIQNMMLSMDKDSEEFLTCLLRLEEYFQPYLEKNLQETVSGLFGAIMGYVASQWGNRGEYDLSDKYNNLIIEGCLRYRRLMVLPSTLYDKWWNYSARKENGIPVDIERNDEEEIKKSIHLSNLAKQERREQFYLDKLQRIKS